MRLKNCKQDLCNDHFIVCLLNANLERKTRQKSFKLKIHAEFENKEDWREIKKSRK